MSRLTAKQASKKQDQSLSTTTLGFDIQNIHDGFETLF
jgi:hypothetical protein